MIPKIQIIIVKYLNKEASFIEIEELENWLKKNKNLLIFKRFVETNYLTSLSMTEENIENAKNEIIYRIKKLERKIKLRKLRVLSIAASVCLIFGITIFNQFKLLKPEVKVNQTIEIGSSKAILTLGNGNQVVLEKGKKFQNKTVNSNGEELTYSQKNKSNKKSLRNQVSYNILTVPRGGKFFINLSDGSKVWLNSDSQLKYPIKFTDGKTREIELLYGEAFFEISPSENHNGSAFNVFTKSQKINVLGTKFNIKAYNEDKFITTTLVEGNVSVQKGEFIKKLNPEQQAKVNFESNEIQIYDVDVSQEISWMSDLFSFNEASLEFIMESLSRWYDVEVVWKTGLQKNFIFTGILERSKSIEDIFNIIEKTSEGELKFEINDKTILIK
tara:strand:- start:2842 stop:4002 length:1161 start_codon:yes stop_codon:yes gene_type:complete